MIEKIFIFHKNYFNHDFLLPRNLGRYGVFLILILIIFSSYINYKARINQWRVWETISNVTFVDGSPSIATNDGGYFLKVAQLLNTKQSVSTFKENRLFPEYVLENKLKSDSINKKEVTIREPSYFEIPLLSIIINWFSSKFFNNDLLTTANFLIPWAAFITAIAVASCFFVMGFGFEGSVAALGAGLAQSLYVRTSIGRVDTDLLNIGLFYSIITFISLSVFTKDSFRSWIWIVIAGLINFIFSWWYQHPGFIIPFLFVILLSYFLANKGYKEIFINLISFTLVSGPNYCYNSIESLRSFIFNYVIVLDSTTITTGIYFPDTHDTITELQKLNFENLRLISGYGTEWLVVLCLIGMLFFTMSNPRKAFILSPAFFLGIMSLISGKRFVIYFLPLFWFGLAYLSTSIVFYLSNYFKNINYKNYFNLSFFPLLMLFLMYIAWVVSPAACRENSELDFCVPRFVPEPSVSRKVSEGFKRLSFEKESEKGVAVTWWDYGYWLNFLSGLSTVHDPGTQRTPKTYLVAKSLMSNNQEFSANILKYISTKSLYEISNDAQSISKLGKAIDNTKNPDVPVYFVLTKSMIKWWSTIAYLGNWDLKNNSPGKYQGFSKVVCSPKSSSEMLCDKTIVNVNNGLISNGNRLSLIGITKNGNKIRQYDFMTNKKGPSLLIQINNTNEKNFLSLDEGIYESTFSQLFLLNKPNSSYFTLIDDGWPEYRVFKLNN